MNKQEFIIAQLKPYFLDPSTCGRDANGSCMYLTKDGKMCVFGKNLTPEALENFKYSQSRAEELLINHGDGILKEESRGILTYDEWQQMQQIHDSISMNNRAKYKHEFMMCSLAKLSSETCDLTELKDLGNFHFGV